MVSTRASIFHMSVPCGKTFPWVPNFLTMWSWPWCLTYLLKTLTLAITFKWYVRGRSYFKGTKIFDVVNLTLVFGQLIKNFNLGYNIWMVSTRVLIFHMSVPCNMTFPWVPTDLTLWLLPWCLTYLLKTLTLLYFWLVGTRSLTFYMNVHYDKNFPSEPRILTLWPWPWWLT
jgi:hypothetical protein